MAYIQILVTEREKEMIRQAGLLVGLRPSTFLRTSSINQARKILQEEKNLMEVASA